MLVAVLVACWSPCWSPAGRHAGRLYRRKNHEKMYLEYAELLHKLRIDGTRDMNKCTAFGDDRSIPADFF